MKRGYPGFCTSPLSGALTGRWARTRIPGRLSTTSSPPSVRSGDRRDRGDELNLSIATHIRRRLDWDRQLTTPVFVEVRQIRRLGEFTSRLEHIGPLTYRVVPFGDLAYLTSMPILFENRIDDLARAHHAIYLTSQQSDGHVNSPAAVPWERLPEVYKQSSRRFAYHISAKMRASGLRLRPSKEPRRLDFSIEEIERLAECEHWRWIVEHRLSGWQRDDERTTAGFFTRTLSPGLISPNRCGN